MLSTEQGQHKNTITPHCILNKLMFKHEGRGYLVGILAMPYPCLVFLFQVGRHSKTKRPTTCVYRRLNSLFSCTEHASALAPCITQTFSIISLRWASSGVPQVCSNVLSVYLSFPWKSNKSLSHLPDGSNKDHCNVCFIIMVSTTGGKYLCLDHIATLLILSNCLYAILSRWHQFLNRVRCLCRMK
jgi:hypothetical protein